MQAAALNSSTIAFWIATLVPGAITVRGTLAPEFDLVCAFDVVEHVDG
jgi:hypothetical protein